MRVQVSVWALPVLAKLFPLASGSSLIFIYNTKLI